MEPVAGMKRWAILVVTLVMAFITNIDASIVNIAIPVMSENLNVGTAATTWVVTAYLIGFTAFIIFFGKLSDLVGKRRVFLSGLAVFTAASVLCSLPLSLFGLLVARVVQALGAGSCMATNFAIIAEVFPENERGRAFGFASVAVALGKIAGPAIGGLILSFLDWRYVFMINVPIGIVALFFGIRLLPNDDKKTKVRGLLDFPGSATFALSFIALFIALSEGQAIGFMQPSVVGFIAAAIVLFVLFVLIERRSSAPMLDLSIFRNRLFSLSALCAFLGYWTLSCSPLILPLYLQDLLGLEPHIAAFILLASPLVTIAVSPISGYLTDKVGPAILTFIGLVVTVAGYVLMGLLLDQNTAVSVIVLTIGISAIGGAMFTAPNSTMIMSTVSKDKYGVASSVSTLVRNAGTAFSTAVSSVILYNRISASIGYRVSTIVIEHPSSFAYAIQWVFLVTAGICAIGAILTGIRLWGSRLRPEETVGGGA